MIGRVIDDKYRIDELLGEGGFALVYRGFDLHLKRSVAIKVLKHSSPDSAFQARFAQECESMAHMDHPGIVTVYSFGRADEQSCLIMQLVEGRSLYALSRDEELSIEEVVPLAVQVCDAMDYAHSQGFLHRDLTLKNIMVEQKSPGENKVKILDFGLAKLLNNPGLTLTNALSGTPHFMAPEQIELDTQDGRLDVFAFGVGLFRMTTGRFPFVGEHATAVMYQTVNGSDPDFPAGYPASFRDIVMKCLARKPDDRYADFAAVKADLEDWLGKGAGQASKRARTTTSLDLRSQFPPSKVNPYLNRVMIQNPREFFGRRREVRRIYSRIDASHPQSISVVGDRRIGKSSLLNFVHSKSNRREHMTTAADTICVYLDFQGKAEFDVSKFIDYLFNSMAVETGDKTCFRDCDRTLDELKNVIEKMHGQGKRMIVMMDEFECITSNDNFDAQFFSFLRSLANSYRVAYVTSSVDELQLMCHNEDISDSPFFNIFSNLPLRPFTEKEALELITGPSAACEAPLAEHAGRILDLAGRFPFFLQIACSSVIEHLLDGDKEIDWEMVTRTYRDEVYPHFEFIWEKMDEGARSTISRIADGQPVLREHEYVAEELQRRGYVESGQEGLTLFSSTFGSFVKSRDAGAGSKSSFFAGVTSLFRRRSS